MRRESLLILIFVSVLSQPSFAQFGIKGGVNIADASCLNAETWTSADSYTGFYLGPKIDIDLFHRIGINTGLFYSKSGMHINGSDNIGLNAFFVPVNIRFDILKGAHLALFAELGPQFSYNVGEKTRQLENGTFNLRDSELSINLAAGIEIAESVQFSLCYNLPFGPTADWTFAEVSTHLLHTDAYRLSTLQVSLAILFPSSNGKKP